MTIYLALLAVAAVALGVGFLIGRHSAPECERQHHETQIVIGRARLTKLDADGQPTGDSVEFPRHISLEFEAEAADPGVAAILFGHNGAPVEHEEPAFTALYDPGPGNSTGRHAVVEPDEEVTQVVPVVEPSWPQHDNAREA